MNWQYLRLLGFGSLTAALLASATTNEAFAQKKGKQAETVSATPADYLLMQKNKEVVGTIVSFSGQSVIVRVDSPHMEPNPNYQPPKVQTPGAAGYNQQANREFQQLRQYQNLQRQMQQAANARNPQEKQRAMQRLQTEMARLQQEQQRQYSQQMAKAIKGAKNIGKGSSNSEPFRLVHSMKDYEFDLQKDAVLRKMFLAVEFDDMGNIKEYTEKQKAELRGTDRTKPGYLATMNDLGPGAEARFSLVPPKSAVKDAKPTDDEGVGNLERPSVKMIVLTKASSTPGIPGAEPKKKGKK
jgi:hypothetical protein